MSMLIMLKEGGTLDIDGNPIDEDIDLLPDAGANGKLTLIETQTLASAQAEFTFSSLQADTFDTHILIGELAVDGTDGTQYEIRMQYTVGGTRITSGNQYQHRFVQIKGGSGARSTRQATQNFHLLREIFDDPANAKSFNIYQTIHNLGSSTLGATQEFRGNSHSSASNSRQSIGGFNFTNTGVVETLHVYNTATNGFATGSRLSLYGVAV